MPKTLQEIENEYAEERAAGLPVTVKRILVCDLEGNGFHVLTTDDGHSWLTFRKRPMNEAHKDRAVAMYQNTYPDAELRTVVDFYARIPTDWLEGDSRVF